MIGSGALVRSTTALGAGACHLNMAAGAHVCASGGRLSEKSRCGTTPACSVSVAVVFGCVECRLVSATPTVLHAQEQLSLWRRQSTGGQAQARTCFASSRAACATIPLARASHMPEPSISGAGEYTSSSYGGRGREENFVNNNLPRGAKLLVIEPSSHA